MSNKSQSPAFRHYVPGSQKYYANHTPSTATPSQIRMGHASGDAHHSSLRSIKPAPTTEPVKTSSSRGGSSGQKQLKFIYYSPH